MPRFRKERGKVMLVLRGEELLKAHVPDRSLKDVERATGASYPTVWKYVNGAKGIKQYDASYLAMFLTAGLGLTIDQAKELRLGDVFDFMETTDAERGRSIE